MIGESRDFSFSGRRRESAKTRGASFSEPAALKVQLGAVGAKLFTFFQWWLSSSLSDRRGQFYRLSEDKELSIFEVAFSAEFI